MQLVSLKTGKAENVGDDDVISSLASGTHAPENAKALINPEGQLVFSPLSDVHANLAQYGYALPTQDQLSEMANQQKYGEGFGNTAKAALEGVSRGTTFGLSDLAESGLGISTPEAIRERKARNPVASTTGEIAGAVGSALLAPELSPAGLLSKAGAGVAEHLAPEAISEGASLASRALNAAGQVGAKAAGSAVEGAAYGLGQTVSEAALGDPNLNAEKVMANIGLSGLLGGALGGALKAGELAIPASVSAAKNAIQNTYDKLIGKVGESGEFEAGPLTKGIAKASSFATGEPEQEILDKAKKVMSGEGEVLSEQQRRVFYRDFNSAMNDHYKTVNKASMDASSLVRPQETAALLENADPVSALNALEQTRSQMRSTIAEMQTAPELYPPRFPAKLQQIMDGLDEKTRIPEDVGATQYTEGARAAVKDAFRPDIKPAEIFEAINDAKKAIDDKIPWNKEISGEAADAVSLIKGLRSQLKTGLEDEATWGEAGARTAAYNDAVNDFLSAKKQFQTDFMKKIPTRSGGVTYQINPTKTNSFFNMINDPRGEIKNESLTNFFRASKKLVDEIDKTYQSSAFEKFDKDAMTGLIEKNEGMVNRAKNVIEQQPGRGFGYVTDMMNAGMAAMGNPLGAVGMAARAVLDPHTTISRLANIERAAQKSSEVISAASEAVFKPTSEAAYKLVGPVAGQMTVSAQTKKYDQNVEQIQEFNNAPAKAIDKLEWATRDMYHVAPNISSSLQMTAIRGNQFLGSKIPQPLTPRMPFDKPFQPSIPQMIKFNRYFNAVHRPLSALDELRNGKVMPETVETLLIVYPSIYAEMKTEILGQMTTVIAKKKDVPYQKRIALSAFLGQPLDASLAPQNIMANQQILSQQTAAKQQQEAGPVNPTAKGIGNLTLSDRLGTNIQNSAQREMT